MYEGFFLQAQALATNSNLMPLAQRDPPIHKHIFHNLILGCARKYFQTTHILAPFFPTPVSFDTILALTTLHFESNNFFMF